MKLGYFNTFIPYKNPLTNKMLRETKGGGGVENVVYNLTVKMAERGHDIHVFSSSDGRNESIERYGKISIYRYKRNFGIGRSPISIDLLYKPLKSKVDLDVVHAHLGNLPAPLTACWYAKKRKKPFVITYHGEYLGGFGGPMRRMGVLLHQIYFADRLFSNADVIIALSKYNINESKLLRKYREKIKIIPNGINLEEFDVSLSKEECRHKLNLPLDKKIILFVGNLIQIKAPHVLLNSMKQVVEEIQDSYLVIVGDGQMGTELKKQSKKLDIANNVRFAGSVRDAFIKALYFKAADVFVLPSFSECFPVVLLEASACRLPLIVSGLESFKAIVEEGHNGLFTKTGDEIDLAKKIIYLLQNRYLRMKLGKNSKEEVKKFTWAQIADQTENVYLELIGN